jgi:hypothetical protein
MGGNFFYIEVKGISDFLRILHRKIKIANITILCSAQMGVNFFYSREWEITVLIIQRNKGKIFI